MKIPMTLALALGVGLLAGCQTRTDSSIPPAADSTVQVEKIAGDKTMMADMMRRSYDKGTFDDALALAMQDSLFAGKVFDVVSRDARFAAVRKDTSRALASTGASKSATSRSIAVARTQPRTTTQRSSGDVLDKTENTMKKANEKLDQASRVRDQIDEARRKAGQIFHP